MSAKTKSVDDWVVMFMTEKSKEWAPSTLVNYKAGMAEFSKWIKGKPVNRQSIGMYLFYLKERGLGDGTIVARLDGLRCFFSWLIAVGLCDENPTSKIKWKAKKKVKHPWTLEEYKILQKHCRNEDAKIMLALGFWTGMSLCDCAFLKWSDIDTTKWIIKSKRQKSGSPFRVSIEQGGELHSILWNALQARDPSEELVMPAMKSRNKVSAALLMRGNLDRIIERSGLPKVPRKTFHDFRAGFCERLINAGINPVVAMAASGHKSMTVFASYATPNDETVGDAVLLANRKAQGEKVEYEFTPAVEPVHAQDVPDRGEERPAPALPRETPPLQSGGGGSSDYAEWIATYEMDGD